MSNIPSLTDLEAILREKPDLREKVSTRGVLNTLLPDALRAKREAIELREKLRQSKASLDDYAARKAASQKQLDDGQKTLAALRQRPRSAPSAAKPTPAPAPSAPSRFAEASDSFLHQAATHRSSPEADKLEARRELETRGFTVSPEGILSRSTRKN
jgi:hypothetical protein